MAVIERTYKRYTGVTSPEWSRFLIIPRHAFRDVFRSKIFTGIFLLSFVWPLVCAILIYLHHNANVLAMWQINVRDLLPIDAAFFQYLGGRSAGLSRVFPGDADRAVTGLARSDEQCAAALSLPSIHSH